ncbi:MAG: phytanoyl-CoA dioxygenase family protein [bacterium]|nr:hypothetical protein [Gammaproteobacteria bacterium]
MHDQQNMAQVLTDHEIEIFKDKGVTRLNGFLTDDKVKAGQAATFKALERAGVWQNEDWQLDHLEKSTAVNAGANLVRGLKKSEALADMITRNLRDAVNQLLDGNPFTTLTNNPQVLFTLPNASRWTVPYQIWHLDIPRLPLGKSVGIQMFTFLNSVSPGGGGTLIVAGSHQLLNNGKFIRSRQVKKRLKKHPYFRDLMSKDFPQRGEFLKKTGQVGDVELQVAELWGDPGDIYLVDMRMLHTLAPNASNIPRIMLTQRFIREDSIKELYGGSGSKAAH